MIRYTVLGFVILLAAATQLYAMERACCYKQPHWYLGMSGGVTFLQDIDLNESAPSGLTQSVSHDLGFDFGGQLGYRIHPNIRVELEGLYFKNKVDTFIGSSLDPSKSTTKTYAFMANGYFDFLRSEEVNPYIGAGIGRAHLDVPITRSVGGESHKLEGWATAYQFLAGANFVVPEAPFTFSLGYRYFNTLDVDVDYPSAGYKVDFNHTSHNIELGGKMYF